MATTTNFGWTTPNDTDLVKDGASAIRTLGSAIDTSMGDLKGGTTGQILAKNSNTDMDFIWTSETDPNAINKTIVDAKGDLIVGTAADTVARLAVGTDGNVLTADSASAGGIKWATIAQKVVQVVYGSTSSGASSTSATWADTNLTATITPTSASNKVLVFVTQNGVCKSAANTDLGLRLSGGNAGDKVFGYNVAATADTQQIFGLTCSLVWLDSPATTSATTYKTQFQNRQATGTVYVQQGNGSTSGILLVEVAA